MKLNIPQVKGGEDLRLDERVEQLFEVMNAVMARSAACRRSRLANKTYKVQLRFFSPTELSDVPATGRGTPLFLLNASTFALIEDRFV